MSVKERLLELLRDGHGGETNERLASLSGTSVRMVDYCLRGLEDEGRIARSKTGRGRNQGREIVVLGCNADCGCPHDSYGTRIHSTDCRTWTV